MSLFFMVGKLSLLNIYFLRLSLLSLLRLLPTR